MDGISDGDDMRSIYDLNNLVNSALVVVMLTVVLGGKVDVLS